MVRMSHENSIDPATIEVVREYLDSAATEMQRTLTRTAYNTIIYEILDLGLSIYDKNLNLIAESPGLSSFLGANDAGINHAIEHMGKDNLNEGDIIILNYPYWSKAHTLDVLLFAPVYYQGELVGFTACRAHWLDLGQKDSGYVLDATDMHQEGVIFPCTKVYKKGEPAEEILELIRFNSRIPDKVIGDLNAQVAATNTGRTRIRELYEKYGKEVVEGSIDAILEHGEKTAREAVEKLPNGTWKATEYADGYGELLNITVEITIDGDEFIADFSESSDQIPDKPLNNTGGQATGRLCFKTITTPNEDSNGGLYEPYKVITREGSIFDPTYPNPTFVGWTGIVGIEAMYKALSEAIPDQIPAGSGGDLCDIMLYGENPQTGQRFVEANNEGVGWGATSEHDGLNASMFISQTMVNNIPIEVFENKAPISFDRLKLRKDSGGAGEKRGGLGIQRDYRIDEETGALSIIQKTRTNTWAHKGGKEGVKNAVVLYMKPGWEDRIEILVDNDDLYQDYDDPYDDCYQDKEKKWAGLMRGTFEEGEIISNRTGGGGGYGDPFTRDPEMVLKDVIDGYVSREAAKKQYGVIINEDDQIDSKKTAKLRNSK